MGLLQILAARVALGEVEQAVRPERRELAVLAAAAALRGVGLLARAVLASS